MTNSILNGGGVSVVASQQLQELNIGATAVGTGLNAGDDYRRRAVENLARYSGLSLTPALNLFRVTQSMGDVLAYSGAMRRLAVEVGKVASDLRLLSLGPRAGLSESRCLLCSPVVDHAREGEPIDSRDGQPGVFSDNGVRHDDRDGVRIGAARVERHDAGNRLERAACLHDPARGSQSPACEVHRRTDSECSRARELFDRSTAMATALSPYIGYAATADLAKESVKTGRPIRDLVLERGLLDAMTRGGIVGDWETTNGETGGAGRAGPAGRAGEAGGTGEAGTK